MHVNIGTRSRKVFVEEPRYTAWNIEALLVTIETNYFANIRTSASVCFIHMYMCKDRAYTYVPYSGKFSQDKIFTDFAVGLTSTKIKSVN